MVLSLCSCKIKLSTTSVPGRNDVPEDIPDIEIPEVKEPTLEELFEAKSTIELLKAENVDKSLIAPAQDKNTELWGYIDLNGNWVIAPIFKSASAFEDEYASVVDVYGDYVFINRKGQNIFEGNKKAQTVESEASYSEGLANVAVDVKFDQKMTYVDTTGSIAIDLSKVPRTKSISYKTLKYVELATPFRNGKAIVIRTTNTTLKTSKSKATETAYIINSKGTVLASLPSGLDPGSWGFDENMRVIVKSTNGLYGLANDSGKMVIHADYLRILHCEGTLYAVCDQNGFWGFMDKDGKTVTDFIYSDAMPYSEGLAAVYDGKAWGFINTYGALLIPCIYDDVQPLKNAGSGEGSGAFSCGIAVVRAGRFWGVIDMKGDISFAAEAEECPILSVCNGYITFGYSEGCGVITTDAKLVLIPIYDNIGEFR